MKKVLTLILLLITCFTITSCSYKKKLDDKLFELSIYELIDAIDTQGHFIFAIIDTSQEESEKMIELLGKYQKTYKNEIYYVDTSALASLEKEYINLLVNYNYDDLMYFTANEGEIEYAFECPKTILDVKNSLGIEDYDALDTDDIIALRNENYESGVEAFEDGYLTSAYNYFRNSKQKKESNDYLLKDEFLILNNWVEKVEKGKNCKNTYISFIGSDNQFYYGTYNGKCSDFDEDKISITLYDYYIKDNIIYTKKNTTLGNGSYEEMFTIIKNDGKVLNVKDKKKEYSFLANGGEE